MIGRDTEIERQRDIQQSNQPHRQRERDLGREIQRV